MTDSSFDSPKTAIIIGAGPAGLTAAYELLQRTNIKPVIIERSGDIGGLSKTVNHKGNRIDIGGHRFFSKSDRVMMWWQRILPVQSSLVRDDLMAGMSLPGPDCKGSPDPDTTDRVMLIRQRLSRIYYLRKFFSYPVTLSIETLSNLGFFKVTAIGVSYLKSVFFPIKNEKSLEDFFINRFGRALYLTFFKDYTEKVWGVPCSAIKPEWGAQRIKGLSIRTAIFHALGKMLSKDATIAQRKVQTSLIERFLYPKLGPGQMWEEVARLVEEQGGELLMEKTVVAILSDKHVVKGVEVIDKCTGEVSVLEADYVFSSMPVRDLIEAMESAAPPDDVRSTACGLKYRDFMTVGLLFNKLILENMSRNHFFSDNWIYIQERDVKLGRLQIFNNWSPYLVKDPDTLWIGLEYFCNEGDELWTKSDADFVAFAVEELIKIGFIGKGSVLDSCLLRVEKAYPAYFGTYDDFAVIRNFVDRFENLFLIGRNGMHRYNNADHSMLSAMTAVDNIVSNIISKDNVWRVNADQDYHEGNGSF